MLIIRLLIGRLQVRVPPGEQIPGPLIGLFLRARLNGRLHRYVVTDLCDEDVASARLPERACEFCPRHDKMSMP